MSKSIFIAALAVAGLLGSCASGDDKSKSKVVYLEQIDSLNHLATGDCFLFTDSSLADFGLMLVSLESTPKKLEFGLAPVQLERTAGGLPAFENGRVKILKVPLSKESVKAMGFPVIHFFNSADMRRFIDFNKKVGNIPLPADRKYANGGKIVKDTEDMRWLLDNWSTSLGSAARTTAVSEVRVKK